MEPWNSNYKDHEHEHEHSPPPSTPSPPPQPQYYYGQPMVMPPPLHYQPAPWPNNGFYGPNMQPYSYTYPRHLTTWSTGLCDCTSDIRNCVVTAVCPCVTFGQIAEIINEGETSWWEGCMLYAFVAALVGPETGGILTGLLGGWYRTKMRNKYKLRGTLFGDYGVNFLCHPCSLCQQYRELGRHGFEVPLGWKKNMEMHREATAVYQVAPVVERGMMR